MKRTALLPLLLLSAVACRPAVTIKYMIPATYTLPPDFQVAAVADRVGRGESGAAIRGLEDALNRSARLKVANPDAVRSAVSKVKTPRGDRLDRPNAEALCAGAGASGIVTLEGYNFSGGWSYEETTKEVTEKVTERPADCKDCPGVEKEVTREFPVIAATWSGSVRTDWAVTSCVGMPLTAGSTSSGGRLEGIGDQESDARDDAGSPDALEGELARATGMAFSAHIVPQERSESRLYFKGGSKDIKAGSKAARDGKWADAEGAWTAALQSSKETVRGKARYNLAVAAERDNRLDEALKHARKAKKLLDGKKGSAEYVSILADRKGLAAAVDAQLNPTP